ncbi:hypothetical protein D3C86_1952970 [compost metagenome]
MTNFIDNLTSVIDGAVISAKLDHRQAERALIAGAARCHFSHQFTQIVLFEAMRIYPADKAVRVARGFQINRRGSRLQQCAVVIGFVVVAVEQHQVAWRQQGIQHHFIGR